MQSISPLISHVSINACLRDEANRAIVALNSGLILPVVAESIFEALIGIAEQLQLPIRQRLHVRLVAIRNHIEVSGVLL